jgi:DNA-binding NarL/FixJ family response regulator
MASNQGAKRPRIVIAEDEALLLYTLKLVVEQHCEVVGEAMDGQMAVDVATQLGPDIVLLDLSMPVFGGIEAMRQIRERVPHIRIIIVSSHTSTIYVEEALNRGAQGYVFKGSAMSQLPKAINEVMSGRSFRPEASGVD